MNRTGFSRLSFFVFIVFSLWLCAGVGLLRPIFAQHDIFDKEKQSGPFSPSKLPGTVRNAPDRIKPSDIPKIDATYGDVLYQLPEDMDPEKMTEEQFYQTLTPAEKVILTPAPKTGSEYFNVALRIAKVGRPQFARILFKKSIDEQGSANAYAQVIEERGVGDVFYLLGNPVIGPTGDQAAEKALKEARQYWESAEELDRALQMYRSSIPRQKLEALLKFRRAGDAAVLMLLGKLPSVTDEELPVIQELLHFLSDSSAEAMLVSLDSDDENLLKRILPMLGTIENGAIPDVLLEKYYTGTMPQELRSGPLKSALNAYFDSIPTGKQALDRFLQRALQFYERSISVPGSFEGVSRVWYLNLEFLNLTRRDISDALYYREGAVRWSKTALQMLERLLKEEKGAVSPELEQEIRALALVSLSEKLYYDQGLDKPLDTTAFTQEYPKVSMAALDRAVAYALKTNHYKAAIIPVILLGKSGEFEYCYSKEGPSPLVKAAFSPDRRLRFTALSAISRLNPEQAYFGSSFIIPTLLHFTTSTGAKKAVSAFPHLEEALFQGRFLQEQGYEVLPAVSGNDVLSATQQNADIELIMSVTSLGRPDLRTTIQYLGKDWRTADVPVIIGAESRMAFSQLTEPERKRLESKLKDIPVKSENTKNSVLESGDAGSPYILREIRAVQINEVFAKYIDDHAEDEEGKLHSDLLYKEIIAPILFATETESDMTKAYWQENGLKNAYAGPLPSDEKSMKWLIEQTIQKTELEPVPAPIRRAQGLAAARMIVRLLRAHPEIYMFDDIEKEIRRFLASPDLFEEGRTLASLIPTAGIQNHLANLLGDMRIPLITREKILRTFSEHLSRHRLKLRGPDIRRLYDRYNASEQEDSDTQILLSKMLDEIEKQTKGKAK